ncbi:MAG: MazG nucleotide pyrophosphohydrolase domain-containing protein [Trueperaceae bacterium]|nr:MazG nucleotide pyrophosphohydrolase domain-containing protein [Trueperaceae bacterium]
MERLLATLRALRAPDGCPWDREQTHESLRPHLLEEAAEAVDALAGGVEADMVEELGDVLLHVGFHAVIAEEDGRWAYPDIERALVEKLVRRHPHVFGDERAEDAAEVEATWARVKASERGTETRDPAGRVPRGLPALARAAALAEALGWSEPEGALQRLSDGHDSDDDAEILADAMLALAIRAARAGRSPELLLRDALASRLGARATPPGGSGAEPA